MISTPKITVIMPSLNVGDYMEECLSSVLNQTLKDIEVICVDAGSTDETLDIIKAHQKEDKRIKLINSDKKSYGHQMNLGIKEAKGKYIGIVETDDYIDENMFKKLYSNSEYGTIDIVKGNFFYLNDYDDNKIEIEKDVSKTELTTDKIFTLEEEPLFVEGHPSIWVGIYRREFLLNNNIKFLEEPKGGWVDNPFFFETAIKAKKIKYIDEALYYYRITNPNSSTNDFGDSTLPMRRIIDIHKVIQENRVQDKNIILVFYTRLFRYIELILEYNENKMENLDYETCSYIQEVLNFVDEKIVKEDMIRNFKVLYYRFMSPLLLLRFKS